MGSENKREGDDQQRFDAEIQKRKLEEMLGKRYEDASPDELIKAELSRLREGPDKSVDLGMTEDTAAKLPETLADQKLESKNKIYEWGRTHGIVPIEGESELLYMLRIYQAKTQTIKKSDKSELSTDDSQESLF